MVRRYPVVIIIYIIILCPLFLNLSCSEKKKRELPDLGEWTFSKSFQRDIIPEIPGNETTCKIYKRTQNGKQEFLNIFELSNGTVYAFGILDEAGKEKIFWDRNNDGEFEQEAKKGEIDIADYGYIAMPVLEDEAGIPQTGTAAPEVADLPDLSEWALIDTQKKDLIIEVPGEETTVKIYRRINNEQEYLHILSLPNGKVFGFGIVNNDTQERKMYWDYDNNGHFEAGMAMGRFNKKAYGY